MSRKVKWTFAYSYKCRFFSNYQGCLSTFYRYRPLISTNFFKVGCLLRVGGPCLWCILVHEQAESMCATLLRYLAVKYFIFKALNCVDLIVQNCTCTALPRDSFFLNSPTTLPREMSVLSAQTALHKHVKVYFDRQCKYYTS